VVDTTPAHERTAAVTTPALTPPAASISTEPPQTPAETKETPPGDSTCLWCGHPFQSHRGGSPQRFCSAQHRNEFWSALRRWGERAVASGRLTIDHIKNGDAAACTLPPGAAQSVWVPALGKQLHPLQRPPGATTRPPSWARIFSSR